MVVQTDPRREYHNEVALVARGHSYAKRRVVQSQWSGVHGVLVVRCSEYDAADVGAAWCCAAAGVLDIWIGAHK